MKYITAFLCCSSLWATPLIITQQSGKTITFDVEIADTPEKRAQGLQGRVTMKENQGMLFIFSPPQPVTMWMMNTPLSLDMLFINEEGKIQQIFTNTTPYSDKFMGPVPHTALTLEIPGGSAAKFNIKPGDHVKLPISKTSP